MEAAATTTEVGRLSPFLPSQVVFTNFLIEKRTSSFQDSASTGSRMKAISNNVAPDHLLDRPVPAMIGSLVQASTVISNGVEGNDLSFGVDSSIVLVSLLIHINIPNPLHHPRMASRTTHSSEQHPPTTQRRRTYKIGPPLHKGSTCCLPLLLFSIS